MKNKIYYDLEFIEGPQNERALGLDLRKWNNIYAYVFAAIAIWYSAVIAIRYVNGIEVQQATINMLVFLWGMFAYYAWNSDPKRWVNKPTIDLISIGMVSEDNREYYAISKDFNLREAWDRYQMKQVHGDARNTYPDGVREYWIRENVLKPIFLELCKWDEGYFHENGTSFFGPSKGVPIKGGFTYKNLKRLINKYGKTNEQIAKEVEKFCTDIHEKHVYGKTDCELYGYYSAYDHVGLCWLFGVMNDLPDGMPWYTIDLKQELERKRVIYGNETPNIYWVELEKQNSYPKQTLEHNALQDAIFNKRLHEFINSL
jgi:hypothetical protein